MGNLSEHFDRSEFACHCGCGFDTPDPVLIEALEALRGLLGGVPIHVSSGCRCEARNAKVGGAPRTDESPGSQHMYGKAADIAVDGVKADDVAKMAEQVKEFADGGIGRYATFTHVDVRGKKARWGK